MSDFFVAESGIRQLHARCVDAVWRKDAKAFADCFTEDGEWHIARLQFRGRAAVEKAFAEFLGQFDRALMTFRTPCLEVKGGTAAGRTYVTEQSRYTNGRSVNSIGIYYERFVEQGGSWRFSWRHFQLHYVGPPDLSGQFFENPEYGPPPGMPALDAPTDDYTGLGN
jgi:ketosteroid isomerase-like protein